MIVKTQGIVLSTVRYSDSSVIARVYTREKGLQACMVRTGKGRTALSKLGLLQPLSLVELTFKNDDRKNLRTVRSIERDAALNSIPFDTLKTCLALFMAEVIGRSIGEEEANPNMFDFLQRSVLMLDRLQTPATNFHLKFLIEFSNFLGFYPHHSTADCAYFDLMEGEFVSMEPLHGHVIEGAILPAFMQLLQMDMHEQHTLRISSSDRRVLLQKLLDYYRLHLHGMKEIGSHKVLEEVLS